MVKISGASLRAMTMGAVMGLGVCASAAKAEDGFSGDLSVSYNSHFVSYGFDVWGGGDEFFGDRSTTFVNTDLYFTKGSLTLYGNLWGELNDNVVSSIGGSIQEIDANFGATYALGPVTLGAMYGFWNYGGDSEGILDFSAALNDADMLIKGFAFNPKVLVHIRTDRGAGQVSTGSAVVLSLGPSFALTGAEAPLTLSLPAGVAFFLDDDFQGGTKGGYAYSYFGGSLGIPLAFIPSDFGTWGVNFDLIYYLTQADAIPGNVEENFLTGSVGIKLAF